MNSRLSRLISFSVVFGIAAPLAAQPPLALGFESVLSLQLTGEVELDYAKMGQVLAPTD